MKIYQLLDVEPRVPLSNEEHKFVESHRNEIYMDQLEERELVVAHNLVRKGVYAISKDNERLLKRGHDINKKSII